MKEIQEFSENQDLLAIDLDFYDNLEQSLEVNKNPLLEEDSYFDKMNVTT